MICRAKSLLTNEFVYGGFVQGKNAWIVQIKDDGTFSHILVDPETVELVEPEKWIPVAERLPENDNYVLVVATGDFGKVHLEHAIEFASFTEEEGWILEMWPEMENPVITYWMAVPEPPKEDPHGK